MPTPNPDTEIQLSFSDLLTGCDIYIYCSVDGPFIVESNRLDVCAEIIQSLVSFLNIQNLMSEVQMSDACLENHADLFRKTKDLQSLRQRLTVDISDQVNMNIIMLS